MSDIVILMATSGNSKSHPAAPFSSSGHSLALWSPRRMKTSDSGNYLTSTWYNALDGQHESWCDTDLDESWWEVKPESNEQPTSNSTQTSTHFHYVLCAWLAGERTCLQTQTVIHLWDQLSCNHQTGYKLATLPETNTWFPNTFISKSVDCLHWPWYLTLSIFETNHPAQTQHGAAALLLPCRLWHHYSSEVPYHAARPLFPMRLRRSLRQQRCC
jgi:hypothetical protein